MRTHPLRLLFVCTANISRSAYAERRARMLLGHQPILVAGAGVPGLPARPMDPAMADQLRQRGGDGEGHLSRCLNEVILADADVVLTFELAQQHRVFEDWPDVAERTFGLGQFADALSRIQDTDRPSGDLIARVHEVARPNSMGWDVDDPYKRGRRAAKAAARQIDQLVESIVTKLTGAASTGPRRLAE